MRAGGGKSLLGIGRLLERGAGAFQVIGGNHDLHAPERGVGKIHVDISVGELPGELSEPLAAARLSARHGRPGLPRGRGVVLSERPHFSLRPSGLVRGRGDALAHPMGFLVQFAGLVPSSDRCCLNRLATSMMGGNRTR